MGVGAGRVWWRFTGVSLDAARSEERRRAYVFLLMLDSRSLGYVLRMTITLTSPSIVPCG